MQRIENRRGAHQSGTRNEGTEVSSCGGMEEMREIQNGPGRQQGATCGTGTVPAGRLTDPLPTEVL